MLSKNYLTIRDYLDQLYVGKPKGRRTYSTFNPAAPKSQRFHQFLMSNQGNKADKSNAKTSGLTIADYLANPVRVKSQYKYLATSRSFEKKNTRADKITEMPARASTKSFAMKNAVSSYKDKIGPQLLGKSASNSSFSKSGDIERLNIEKSIRKAARKYKLSPSLIRGVIKAESNFQVSAVSHAGAQGLMQLMPATARELGVKNPFDIDQNIDGGSRYLRKMLDNFKGDIKLALAAYNAGPGTVRKYEGEVPYQETKQYVNRVLRYSRNLV
jgi:soluble lytic murein transglycosylase-like protein